MIGDDPLKLEIKNTSPPKEAWAKPYRGRYPCGSLVHNGIWYYGTYCLGPKPTYGHNGFNWNWPNLGPMPGFQISRDLGRTWEASPLTPEKPLFPEPAKPLGPVKMGAPHFVDFGKNMEHSPDGKAYLLGMGADENDPHPRPCLKPGQSGEPYVPDPECKDSFAHANLSWISADRVYLARVTPSPGTINDINAYEFFAGNDAGGKPVWTADFPRIKPLLEWSNHMTFITGVAAEKPQSQMIEIGNAELAAVVGGDPSPGESNCADAAGLGDVAARVDFDLGRGVFSLSTPSATKVIRDAYASVEGWKSTDAGYKRRVISKTADRMLIECAREDAPTLLLEFALQPGFVVLRTGLKNTTTALIRIKKFEPLSGGTVFPGGKWSDTRTLTANTAGNDPKVDKTVFAKSANNLLLTLKQDGVRRSLVIGALRTEDYTKWLHILPLVGKDGDKSVGALIEAIDPVGKEVDPGETYMPADSFYVDFRTPDPFAALEKYGMALREATHARPNLYDFPTVCAWYAGVWKTPGAQDHPEKSTYRINSSAGLVEEAGKINEHGFLKYSRAAVRLVPDNYTEQNPQGWWDDEHWQLHGLYTEPFETTVKLGKGMHERGCLAFTYIQPTRIRRGKQVVCLDFRSNHVDWLIGKDENNTLDYSLPAVQEHLRSRFARLNGSIDGLMVDYCDDLWDDVASRGRFSDRKMTATAFYRMFFKKLREGIGEEARIHERNVQAPDNELTVGLVDSQRTAWDTDMISPAIVSRSGLRWYRNRAIYSYDMDSKELNSSWKSKDWNGDDKDGRRMMLTMAYVAASRLLIANSFRDLSKETLYDLSRTFPYHTEPKSARPIDVFVHEGHPRVYDFAVTPDWHQVTLYNNTLPTREEIIAVPLAGDAADGALGLDRDAEYHVYDFWNDAFAGTVKGAGTLTQTLRPGEARMLSIRKVRKHPQVLSSTRHGWHSTARHPGLSGARHGAGRHAQRVHGI